MDGSPHLPPTQNLDENAADAALNTLIPDSPNQPYDMKTLITTLVDEGEDAPLLEDVVINAFEDCVTVEQVDPQTDEVLRITLSMAQIRDLAAMDKHSRKLLDRFL